MGRRSWEAGVWARAAAIALPLLAAVACHFEPCRTLTRSPTTDWPASSDLATDEAAPVPRCAAIGPNCGPQPIHDVYRCYRPSDKRDLLPPRATGGDAGDVRNTPNRCSQDGECQLNGCGNECTSYRVPSHASECLGYAWLDERALCGCVDGVCAVFRAGR